MKISEYSLICRMNQGESCTNRIWIKGKKIKENNNKGSNNKWSNSNKRSRAIKNTINSIKFKSTIKIILLVCS